MSRIYNLKPTPSTHELFKRPLYHSLRADLHDLRELKVPAPIDWIDDTAGVPPIENQLSLGACQSFQARNAMLLADWLATKTLPGFDLSKLFIYWNDRAIEDGGQMDVDTGGTIGNTLLGIEQNGVAEESFWPYDVTQLGTKPPDLAFANALTHKYDLKAVPLAITFEAICDALQDGSPIIGGFSVPPSFEACGPTGQLPDPTGESSLGGHAFSVCQAKRSDQWMDDPNSWGAGWGKGGHGFMPASYIGRVMELWTFVPGSLLD
jgi:hypothetical protein